MSTSPVSTRTRPVELAGGRFTATVRPANYEEIQRCQTRAKSDKFGAHVQLFDAANVEKVQLPATARFSLGIQVVKISGAESYAEEIKSDDLPQESEAMAAYLDKLEKSPDAKVLCFRVTYDEVTLFFLLLEPDPSRFESYTKAKTNGGAGIDADLAFVKQHRFFGDLDALKRDAPLAIQSLAAALNEVGGVCFEAMLGEA